MNKPKARPDKNQPKVAPRPTKSVAAAVLRGLSNPKYLNVPDPEQTAVDLRMIADCILGEQRWSRGGKYPPDVQRQINFFAGLVERHRAYGLTVNGALDAWSRELARVLGRSDDPDAQQELRDAIAYARKAGRKRKDK